MYQILKTDFTGGSTGMGAGDSIRKAAEDAMRDLGGVSEPTDDGNTPEPGSPEGPIQSHASISEGSNAMEDQAETSPEGHPDAGREHGGDRTEPDQG